jgi:chemotaxis protein CheD
MKHVVGVSDMKVSSDPDSVIITHSLGSCVGISVYDPVEKIGGLLHFQLPCVNGNGPTNTNPFRYADTGIPTFFKKMYEMGANRSRIEVKAAGGATIMDPNGFFNIGKRNVIAMKKLFWKNGIFISGEDLGGECWRTMHLEIDTGRVLIRNNIYEKEL